METKELFKDVLVVELASVLAGPAVGMFFAELGAKVIKIENALTGGDVTRTWKLPTENADDEYSAYYHCINWGKEEMLLNLQDAKDHQQVLKLIKKADIVISNFKQDSATKLKMDYDSLKELNPSLIYASISAYGEDSSAPGFDAMIQAETGWISMTGEKNGKPVKLPVAMIDIQAAHQLKQGVLLALWKRQMSGQGSKVTVSLFDASVASLANQASNWLNENSLPKRMGSQHPNIAPYGDIFLSQDGVQVILGTGTQKQFEGLCECLHVEHLISDPRFLNNKLRLTHREDMNEFLREAFAKYDYADIKEACMTKKVTLAPINDLETVFKLPSAQALVLEQKQKDGSIKKSVKTAVFKIS